MKSKNSNTDVIEVEAEEMLPEIPLEKVIENTLVKANVTDQVITALKEKYGNMKLANVEDKETYLDIKEARREVRKVGIITEKLCKKGREDAVAIQRKWLAKEKEILGKIAEVENPLNDEIEKFDNEVERKEIVEQKRKEEIYINRQSTLSKMGATYDNGSFVLNHISYQVELLKSADEDMWNDTILPKYRKVFEEIEAVKVAEENKRKEELAQQKKEREEFEAKQKKFKEQQEAFAKQQYDLQKQKDEHERQQRLEQERKDAEEKQRKQKVYDARIYQLRDLGLEYDYAKKAYVSGEVEVYSETQINSLNDYGWNELIEIITPRVKELLKEASERVLEENKKREETAIQKALEDEKIKKQQEQQQKELELAQANDKTKWLSFISEIKIIAHSEMKSPKYRRMQQQAKEKIEEIINL